MFEFDVAVLTERYLKGWHDACVVGLMGYEANEERRRCGLLEVAAYMQETFPAQVEEAVLQDLAKSRLRIAELEAKVKELGDLVVQTYEEDDVVTQDMAKADWAHAYSKAVADGDRFVLVELTIPVVMRYPKDWDNALIEFYMGGGSSSCGSNWWSHIERTFTISGCMCETLNHRVARDATPLEAETGIVQEPYE
jgi:hypothetical protein